ncbi:MAG: DUF2510 domain-containing protein, partial [bacterium]|nr:DUF2510 domain-containing protein [bacterium]
MTTTTPAGWYQDPNNPSAERWFDGSQWTTHLRTRPPEPVTPPPPQQRHSSDPQTAGGGVLEHTASNQAQPVHGSGTSG